MVSQYASGEGLGGKMGSRRRLLESSFGAVVAKEWQSSILATGRDPQSTIRFEPLFSRPWGPPM